MEHSDTEKQHKTSPWKERLFQTALAMIATAIGFWGGLYASDRGYIKTQADQREHIIRVIHAATKVDLDSCGSTANSIKSQIETKKFPIRPYVYEILYHPSPALPFGSEIGCLNPEVINGIETYRQKLRICEDYRQSFLRELWTPDSKNRQVAMFCYYMGLESVVSCAEDLLALLYKHYPHLTSQPSSPKRSHSAGQLAKIIEEETDKISTGTKERWRFQIEEPTNQLNQK